MANAFGMIDESIWRRDREFRALPRGAQCTFLQLLSQRDVDTAGVLTLHVDLLAKGCDEITSEDIRHDLKTLEAARFIYVDDDTDELLIRSYVRRVTAKSPNALKSALKLARTLASPKLRHILAGELRRIGKAETVSTANEIDPGDNPSGSDLKDIADPIRIPSERGIPSGRDSEPPSYSSVTALASPTVVGLVGEGPALAANVDNASQPSGDDPPPMFCSKHMPDGTTDACQGCRRQRERFEAWEERHRDDEAVARRAEVERQAEIRLRAIENCTRCDDDGYIGTQVCSHRDHSTPESRAAARAELAAAIAKGGDHA